MIGSAETDAVRNLTRLNQCIDSAASVLSSASTILDDRRSWAGGDDMESLHPGSNRLEVVEWINRSETGTPSTDLPSLPDLPELPGAAASASTRTAGTEVISTMLSETHLSDMYPTPPPGQVPDSNSMTPFTSYNMPPNSAISPMPTAQPLINQPPVYMYMTPQGWQVWDQNQAPQSTLAPNSSINGQPGELDPSVMQQFMQLAWQHLEPTLNHPPRDVRAPTPPAASHPVQPQAQAPMQPLPTVQVSTPDTETEPAQSSTPTGTATETATEAETTIAQTHKRTKSGSRMSRFLSLRWKFQSSSGSKKPRARSYGGGAEIRRKFVFIGDGACGKTCLLMSVSSCARSYSQPHELLTRSPIDRTTSKGTYPEASSPPKYMPACPRVLLTSNHTSRCMCLPCLRTTWPMSRSKGCTSRLHCGTRQAKRITIVFGPSLTLTRTPSSYALPLTHPTA